MPARKTHSIPQIPSADGRPKDAMPKRRTTKKIAPREIAPEHVDPDERYAPTAWGAGSSGEHLEDIRVPSGQLCQVRRPGVEGLLKAGVLHDIDSLTAIVDQKHVKRAKGQQQIDIKKLTADPSAITNVLHVTDRIVCYIVVQPSIEMTPNDITNRKDGVIYADMVDLEDKMFLLNYAVGGTRDLERFRGELHDVVRNVDSLEAVEDSAE